MPENFVLHTTPIEEMLEKLSVERVFGTPTHENGITIIPVAQVDVGFGYGGGYGRGPNGKTGEQVDGTSTTNNEGVGSGGGGGGRATPRGYLHITSDGVRYEPIVDATRIPLAGMLMGAWAIFWITATIRTIARAIAKRKKAM
ncbi:MAG: spore germination protein GerW family protein [Caldilineaceae bacterium]